MNKKTRDGGWTALMFAAKAGAKKAIKVLIKAGANVNEANDLGLTPLAFSIGHYRSVYTTSYFV